MTDSMIERVARALCRCRASQPDYVLGWSSVDQEVHYCWNEWVEEARAAIQAMRTPTEAMVDAGYRAAGPPPSQYVAMTDAALKEKP